MCAVGAAPKKRTGKKTQELLNARGPEEAKHISEFVPAHEEVIQEEIARNRLGAGGCRLEISLTLDR